MVIDRKPFIISVTVCFHKNGLQFIGMLTVMMMEATEQADRQLESKGVMLQLLTLAILAREMSRGIMLERTKQRLKKNNKWRMQILSSQITDGTVAGGRVCGDEHMSGPGSDAAAEEMVVSRCGGHPGARRK